MEHRRIAAPTGELITLTEAQEHLRAQVGGSDAALIKVYLRAACETVEDETGRALLPQTWQLRLHGFPCHAIELPRAPLLEVVEVAYTTADGTEAVLDADAYRVETQYGPYGQPGKVHPVGAWPAAAGGPGAVRVTYRAGYASADEVPAPLKAAALLALGDLYNNREAQGAGAASALSENLAYRRLLGPYRVWWA